MSNNQLNLDSFNRVSDNSQLTHQNLLSTMEKLFPNQDFEKENLKCEIAPTIDSIDNSFNDFKSSSRPQLSLILCNGKIEDQVDRLTGRNYSEATGGNHWTTVHFRKDQKGKINAFYADSLNPNSTTVPSEIKNKLRTLGIDVGNIHKMKCQDQGINQCGDYSAFNAKAMDQMSLADLKTGSIKPNIELENGQQLNAQNFSRNLRQDLMAEFNGDNNQRNFLNDSSQKQSQRDLEKAISLSKQSFLDEQFDRDTAKAISLSQQSFLKTENSNSLLDNLRKEDRANTANQSPSQEHLKDKAIKAQDMIFRNQSGLPIDQISASDRRELEDIALKLAIENSLRDNNARNSQSSNNSQDLQNVPVYQSLGSNTSEPDKIPVYAQPGRPPSPKREAVYAKSDGTPSPTKQAVYTDPGRPPSPTKQAVYTDPGRSSTGPINPPPPYATHGSSKMTSRFQ